MSEDQGPMADDPLSPDDRPVAAIFRSPVFNASEAFVQAQAAGLARYQPLIVGLEDKGHVAPALARPRPAAARPVGAPCLPAGPRRGRWRSASAP